MNVENFLPNDLKENRKDYWQMRETLIPKYNGKWIAFHKKKVIVSSDRLDELRLAIQSSGVCAYITKVGEEKSLAVKIRRKEFCYNTDYEPALPQAQVQFFNFYKTGSKVCDDAIPDTGADATCLSITDCHEIQLFDGPAMEVISRSYGGGERESFLFLGYAEINDKQYSCSVEPTVEREVLLGRDVLNQLMVTFNGPESKVVFE